MLIRLTIGNPPETVLIGVETPSGNPEENAECFADIISLDINLENKPLQNLESIYDFVDSSTYFASQDKGFYLLETGFENYQGEFEVKIVCYSPGFSGVSYTIVTDKDNTCEIKEDGKFLVC